MEANLHKFISEQPAPPEVKRTVSGGYDVDSLKTWIAWRAGVMQRSHEAGISIQIPVLGVI